MAVATGGAPSEFGNLAIIERLELCVARDGVIDGVRATERLQARAPGAYRDPDPGRMATRPGTYAVAPPRLIDAD
jgi:hypothetical protein